MDESKKTKIYRVITICLCIALAISFFMIVNLNEELSAAKRNLNNSISELREEINSIYGNVDNSLKKQASIISDIKYNLGKFDSDSQTVPVYFSVIPKTFSDDTKIFIEADKEKIELIKDGENYIGTINVSLFVDYEERVLLTIEENGKISTEFLEDVSVSTLFERVLPHLYADMTGTSHYGKDFVRVEAGFSVEEANPESSSVKFESFLVIHEKNGKEIDRKDITSEVVKADGSYYSRYTHTFEASKGDEVKIYVVAEDSLGFVHKSLVSYLYRTSEDETPVSSAYNESIYSSDGTLLYGEDI